MLRIIFKPLFIYLFNYDLSREKWCKESGTSIEYENFNKDKLENFNLKCLEQASFNKILIKSVDFGPILTPSMHDKFFDKLNLIQNNIVNYNGKSKVQEKYLTIVPETVKRRRIRKIKKINSVKTKFYLFYLLNLIIVYFGNLILEKSSKIQFHVGQQKRNDN